MSSSSSLSLYQQYHLHNFQQNCFDQNPPICWFCSGTESAQKTPVSHSSSTRVPCSYFMISFVIIVSQYVTYQHVDSFYNIRVEMRISQKKIRGSSVFETNLEISPTPPVSYFHICLIMLLDSFFVFFDRNRNWYKLGCTQYA